MEALWSLPAKATRWRSRWKLRCCLGRNFSLARLRGNERIESLTSAASLLASQREMFCFADLGPYLILIKYFAEIKLVLGEASFEMTLERVSLLPEDSVYVANATETGPDGAENAVSVADDDIVLVDAFGEGVVVVEPYDL